MSDEVKRISDKRLESLARAYAKMGFESTFAEIASAFRELQEFRRRPSDGKLREALATLRGLVNEGGVPRYTVTPGAALNAVIEEVVDPILAATERKE